jgi:translocation and assembly module TamB
VVLRAAGGRLRFDPIDARLNQGRLHLEPQWVQDGDGPARLQFGPSSTLENAMVNDEVSHRVLAYVAPILDGATRVEGRVSVQQLHADFPVFGPGGTPARVEGDVLFDEVRFLPGPLANDLLSLLPHRERRPSPMLVLRDPISFRIAEGKVDQHGLVIPLGQVATVGIEGSVDFDKRLDLVARLAVNPPRADAPVLSSLVRAARFELPIGGTLEHPKIDKLALKERLKSLGSDLLETSVAAGAQGLLRLLEGLPTRRQALKPAPSPPEADRPKTPNTEEHLRRSEARRLERLEKKAERRARRIRP